MKFKNKSKTVEHKFRFNFDSFMNIKIIDILKKRKKKKKKETYHFLSCLEKYIPSRVKVGLSDTENRHD